MKDQIKLLEPSIMWKNFADLNAVPRPSKKEEKVIEFIKNFGNKLGLPTIQDETGNIIIKKPATPGMENRKTVALQSHLDMVCQKNAETIFDFEKQGIDMFIDGDWVKAVGTTLGADNGIGVASIMGILESKNIAHPAIEALFTVDEETGMTGALGLKGGLLDAEIMLNLDTEDDNELTIGCAGGIDVNASGTYPEESAPAGFKAYTLKIKGLTGGHSGMDIIKGRGNANKIMNRILYLAEEKFQIRIASINGGSLRNAIPRESVAEFIIEPSKSSEFEAFISAQTTLLIQEYALTDAELKIILESNQNSLKVLTKDFQQKILRSIYSCPSGIYRMSPAISGLVQTSNNLARVLIANGEFTIQCLTRSSVDSEKIDMANSIKSAFELSGSKISFGGSYPGWTPKPDAGIVKLMRNLYQELYQEEALVSACHAGLECGILGTHYPDMEMISFGPNIRGAHSPEEKVQISSVQKYWAYLLETLKRIPAKN